MRPVDVITDIEDPRIAMFRAVRERDVAGRGEGFIAEGEVVLRAAVLGGRRHFATLLLAEKRVEKLRDVIEALPAKAAIYTAPQAVLDGIVGFHIHRGILGYGRRWETPDPAALLAGLPSRARVLVLFGIGNHDNMGGLFRNAAAFGVGAVLLDSHCCDPLYRKAIRVSVGGVLTTPFARLRPGDDPIALLEAHGFGAVALTPRGEVPLSKLNPPPRAALLLGTEGEGLSEAVLARCRTVSIPMAGGFDSLNVATTSGIALHQLVFGGA